jgi:phosphatidylglycerophosphatase A
MVIKESSDELNPTGIAADFALATPRPARSAKDYLALAIATCGVGYLPLAPGTWGSLVGIGLFVILRDFFIWFFNYAYRSRRWGMLQSTYAMITLEAVTIALVTLVGIWAASRTEKLSGKKDPGKVVVDEVAGQMIALLPVPFVFGSVWWTTILAFILFRFFDIVKPYPARRFESLHGGLGIMADDVVAGVYAAMFVAVAVVISWFV